MDLEFPAALVKALLKAGVKSPIFQAPRSEYREADIESQFILPEDYDLIKATIKRHEHWEFVENRRIFKKLEALSDLEETGKKTVIKKLEVLEEALRRRIDPVPNRWVFMEIGSVLLPFFVSRIKFHPHQYSHGCYIPAHVDVSLEAMNRGEKDDRTVQFHREDLGKTVKEILSNGDLILASEKLMAEYTAEMEIYSKEIERTGEQFLARGYGKVKKDRWNIKRVRFDRDGEPTKVVMDDYQNWGGKEDEGEDEDSNREQGVADTRFWDKTAKKPDTEEDEAANVVMLPIHPYVNVFNLKTHGNAVTHITNLTRYVYDTKIIDKLVIPGSTKQLIDSLTGTAIQHHSDIIKGKAQGIIILCSGRPGTGKTLTGEVYAEAAQRPLYVVQCSQLGTDETSLERQLGVVLQRATRWKAILLIDEADVYIHERGEDIVQNAIVGVFLRLLEYYNGILFMTTNRATIIDDAILSRMTAHVKYKIPAKEDRKRIWEVLLTQYGVASKAGLIQEAIDAFPNVSGRSIRQLIKLALLLTKTETLTMKDITRASKFHDYEGKPEDTK